MAFVRGKRKKSDLLRKMLSGFHENRGASASSTNTVPNHPPRTYECAGAVHSGSDHKRSEKMKLSRFFFDLSIHDS